MSIERSQSLQKVNISIYIISGSALQKFMSSCEILDIELARTNCGYATRRGIMLKYASAKEGWLGHDLRS